MFNNIEKDGKWQVKEMPMMFVWCRELDFLKLHLFCFKGLPFTITLLLLWSRAYSFIHMILWMIGHWMCVNWIRWFHFQELNGAESKWTGNSMQKISLKYLKSTEIPEIPIIYQFIAHSNVTRILHFKNMKLNFSNDKQHIPIENHWKCE